MSRKNALGETLSPAQDELAQCYDRLVALLREHRGELAPFEVRNDALPI